MSKKPGKKQTTEISEIDLDSPEWKEAERKKRLAYEMVQRVMIRSQVGAMRSTRDNLMNQRTKMKAKLEQQSRDQSDISQYLRNKLKDNYATIAELETKVSETHERRLKREKELEATAKKLDEKRQSEKSRLLERLEALDVELGSIKEFQENSATYEQKLKNLETRINVRKEALDEEVALLNSKIQDEWENGRKNVEESIKRAKKAAAKATQEQLDPRTRHMINQNKKMMDELRFQCFEVEKMQRARHRLLESKAVVFAKAASARHSVENLARRSRLLQRIIRSMHEKLHKCQNFSSSSHMQGRRHTQGCNMDGESSSGELGADETVTGRVEKRTATPYKLAGMSEEERQQLLNLREELRLEEIGIAAARALMNKKCNAMSERSRELALKADLARIIASCHEDTLLGVGSSGSIGGPGGMTTNSSHRFDQQMHLLQSFQSSHPISPFHQHEADGIKAVSDAPPSHRHDSDLDHVGDDVGAQGEWQGEKIKQEQVVSQKTAPLLPAIAVVQPIGPAGQNSQQAARGRCNCDSSGSGDGSRYSGDQSCAGQAAGMSAGLPLWPENVPLPIARTGAGGGLGEGEGWKGEEGRLDARYLDVEVLKAVSRLFLAKLQVSVESITPRTAQRNSASFLPALAGSTANGVNARVSWQGARLGRKRRRRIPHGRSGFDGPVRRVRGMVDGVGGDSSLLDRAPRRRIAEDEVTAWSDRVTTGIPAWDMLEAAVRQTKRRTTCNRACQTLTYRELRDGVGNVFSATPNGVTPALVSMRTVKAANESCSISLATITVSDTPVHRAGQDGETVVGAAIRGGSGVRRGDEWSPAQPIARDFKEGANIAESRYRSKGGGGDRGGDRGGRDRGGDMGSEKAAGIETVSIRQAKADKEPTGAILSSPQQAFDVESVEGVAACAVEATRRRGSLLRKSVTTNGRGCLRSSRVAQVSVSWGEDEGDAKLGTALEDVVGFKNKAVKRGSICDGDPWSMRFGQEESRGKGQAQCEAEHKRGCKGYYHTDRGGSDGGASSGGAYLGVPLSKGPDYRKVVLFTVEDTNRRLFMERSSPARNDSVPGHDTCNDNVPCRQ